MDSQIGVRLNDVKATKAKDENVGRQKIRRRLIHLRQT